MKNDYTVFEPDLDLCVAFDEAIECLPQELDLLEIVASLLVPDLIPPMH